MTSINIGKVIYTLLNSDAELSNMVNGNIYPLIAEQFTQFPFIIYKRSNLINASNKDGSGERVGVDVLIACENYADSVAIAERVRMALEGKSYNADDDFNVDDIILNNAGEAFIQNTYIQQLTFTVIVDNEKD